MSFITVKSYKQWSGTSNEDAMFNELGESTTGKTEKE